MKVLAILFGLAAGFCLMVLQMRKKLPLWGSLLSPKMHIDLDSKDKILLIAAAVFCLLCLASVVTVYG